MLTISLLSGSSLTTSVDPLGPRSHILLGASLEAAGIPEEAEASYARALEIEPGSTAALCALDALLARGKRTADRIGLWLPAARRDPASQETLSRLASVLGEDGRTDEADMVRGRAATAARCVEALGSGGESPLGLLRRIVEEDPGDPVALAMLGHALRTEAEAEDDPAGRAPMLAAAADALQAALSMEPYWIWARLETALASMALGRHAEALEALAPVTLDRPQVWEARMTAASGLGDHALAARAGDRMLEAPGADPGPGSILAVAREHALAGDSEGAAALARRVFGMIPEGPSALRASAEKLLS